MCWQLELVVHDEDCTDRQRRFLVRCHDDVLWTDDPDAAIACLADEVRTLAGACSPTQLELALPIVAAARRDHYGAGSVCVCGASPCSALEAIRAFDAAP